MVRKWNSATCLWRTGIGKGKVTTPMYNPSDATARLCQERLAQVRIVTGEAILLLHPAQRNRVLRLLHNYRRWGLPNPTVILTVHDGQERNAVADFTVEARHLANFHVLPQGSRHEVRQQATNYYWQSIDPNAKGYELNRAILHLRRRGGRGTPKFIDTFSEGDGTTCEQWTPTGGFIQAAVTGGHCPVGCRMCFAQGVHQEPMTVYLNLEDLKEELQRYAGCRDPINFCARSGLIEYDRWFSDEDGQGSIAQFIIDACAAANVSPLFLSKIAFPRYLRFHGTVHVGVSLMPEALRQQLAPFSSPSDELLDSLAWALNEGAAHPVIRLFVMRQHLFRYTSLLAACRDRLGTSGWRVTVDVPRFAPDTLSQIAIRYPELEPAVARELEPRSTRTLREIAGSSRKKVKQIRPPLHLEVQVYRRLRDILDRLGCQAIPLTPCKGHPAALLPLVEEGILCRSPCACYAPKSIND